VLLALELLHSPASVLGVRDPVLMVVAISLAESRASDTVSPSSSEAKLSEESRSTVLA
jgi:hypothetical protein